MLVPAMSPPTSTRSPSVRHEVPWELQADVPPTWSPSTSWGDAVPGRHGEGFAVHGALDEGPGVAAHVEPGARSRRVAAAGQQHHGRGDEGQVSGGAAGGHAGWTRGSGGVVPGCHDHDKGVYP